MMADFCIISQQLVPHATAGRRAKNSVDCLQASHLQKATFGAGCFWGPELMFQRIPGVVATEVGYAQGHIEKPTYEDVCSGDTGHTEAVQVLPGPLVSIINACTLMP